MNITYILGNGFDLNFGMATSYDNFYEYYKSIDSPNDDVKKLKATINEYVEGKSSLHKKVSKDNNWEDLELALGAYTKEMVSVSEFRNDFFDINTELKKYLLEQETTFLASNPDPIGDTKKDLAQPDIYFRTKQLADIAKLIKQAPNSLNIINFNYTRIIEKLSDYQGKQLELGLSTGHYSTRIMNVIHVHGALSDVDLILGVNDVSQIANESFRDIDEVTELLVKPQTNDYYDINKNNELKDIIATSAIIIIFGASMGDTDLMWREAIKNRLNTNNCIVILYENEPKYIVHHPSERWDKERFFYNHFLELLGIGENERKKYETRVFVGYNTNMFIPGYSNMYREQNSV